MSKVHPGINIWSGATGLAGALTNMTERAKEKGKIKHSYPVSLIGRKFEDAEQAYQLLKRPLDEDYNDGLMVDIIAAKLLQHQKLLTLTTNRGGVAWLERCSHMVKARSVRAASWEGYGRESRFMRNLIAGYVKAVTGKGEVIRVVHVSHAPFDLYIGRSIRDYRESIWHNPFQIGVDGTREEVLFKYLEYIKSSESLLNRLGELQGKTLGCWCVTNESPEENCHGHILASLAQGLDWEPIRPRQKSLFDV